jgi:hypothetical protein
MLVAAMTTALFDTTNIMRSCLLKRGTRHIGQAVWNRSPMSCRQLSQNRCPQGILARRLLSSQHTLHSSGSSPGGKTRVRMDSEWRGRANELKEPSVDTQATYAMARLNGSLGGSLVKCPQRHSTHARMSLDTSDHVLCCHSSGSPQSTTSVRVCSGNMMLILCLNPYVDRKTVPRSRSATSTNRSAL